MGLKHVPKGKRTLPTLLNWDGLLNPNLRESRFAVQTSKVSVVCVHVCAHSEPT